VADDETGLSSLGEVERRHIVKVLQHTGGNRARAAKVLGIAPSTIHRLLNDGIVAGEQLTPGAPWRIRLSEDLMARFNGDAGDGFLPMREAMRALGVSRQTVLHRVKRGELGAVHVMRGKQKGLRIKVIDRQPGLFDPTS